MKLADRSQQLMMVTIASTAVIFLVSCVMPRSADFPDFTPITLNSTNLDHVTKEDVFFVLVIPTMADHFAIREEIRATWMNTSRWANGNTKNSTNNGTTDNYSPGEEYYKRFKVMFIVAETEEGEDEVTKERLENEANENGDIFLITGLDEHRYVLKYKVIWGFQQSLALYNYTYVIKTDDDIMVNLPYLVNLLKAQPRRGLYTGHCKMGYGGFHGFPHWRYCSGGGYIISRDVVERMMELPRSVHRVPFRPEDGYSGWLIYNLKNTPEGGVTPIPNGHVFNGKKVLDMDPPYDSCFYHRTGGKNFEKSIVALNSEPVAQYRVDD